MTLDAALLAVCVASIVFGLGFARATRGITFFGTATDNQKQAATAAQSRTWRWPSDMHRSSGGKSYMKDVVIIGVALFQRLTGLGAESDRPLVLLCGWCNALAGVLVFVVARGWWGTGPGLLVASLYLTSQWPWQIALMGGHVCVAQVPFLACVALLQASASGVGGLVSAALFAVAGAAFGWMQFSSASARKFIAPVAAALLVATAGIADAGWASRPWDDRAGTVAFGAAACFAIVLPLQALLRGAAKRAAAGDAPKWVLRLAGGSAETRDIARAVRMAYSALRALAVGIIAGTAYASTFGAITLATVLAPFFAGFLAAVLVLLLPGVVANLRGYFSYWGIAAVFGHFRLYREYFAERGTPIPDDMRGAGWLWVWRVLMRVAPVPTLAYIAAVGWLKLAAWDGRVEWPVLFGVALVSISPIAWGEITRGPQLARSYLPGLLGVLAAIAFAARVALDAGAPVAAAAVAAAVIVAANAAWSARVFFGDVLPARMAPARLAALLEREGATRVYAYDTPFNDALLGVLPPELLSRLDVRRISSLADVGEEGALVVVPGTSSKALNMESTREGYTGEDFASDPVLERLLASKGIEDVAVAGLPTFGTSRIWVHESEVSSYRDLMMHEISDEDRWRGMAWLLKLDSEERKQLSARTTGGCDG
ncbi:MAG: hypothetical protein WC971_04610 [Coriobacteriia bacterium]